jgi:hypothetical protein
MPEMTACCGGVFRVLRHASQICIDGSKLCGGESALREFAGNDVYVLEGLRCDGAAHGGCGRSCVMMWKAAWLNAVAVGTTDLPPETKALEILRDRLPTQTASGSYFCQSTEMIRTTRHLSFRGRLGKLVEQVSRGNRSVFRVLLGLWVWLYWKLSHRIRGVYPKGTQSPTPVESLGLQVGERVQVKSLSEILKTLDVKGCNRGLHFSPDMIPYCGKQCEVLCRADRIIVEGLGTTRALRNTVILKHVNCDADTYAFGGCSRDDVIYWREIWLRRAAQDK